jgi:hypothetical protein
VERKFLASPLCLCLKFRQFELRKKKKLVEASGVFNPTEGANQFRSEVYGLFERDANGSFEVVDRIAASRGARCAAEISMSGVEGRRYSSVYKSVERMELDWAACMALFHRAAATRRTLTIGGYAVYALDHTAYERKNAHCLKDRGIVRGNGCNVIGHQYSILGSVLHAKSGWLGIECFDRIPTDKTPVGVGCEQIGRLRQQSRVPCVVTTDSEYSTAEMLAMASQDVVLLMRLRGTRHFFREIAAASGRMKRGRPRRCYESVKLKDEITLGQTIQQARIKTADGGYVQIDMWNQVLFRNCTGVPGYLLRIRSYRADGTAKLPQPIWVFWTGPATTSCVDIWHMYERRFCVEAVNHFFKHELPWSAAHFISTEAEENWTKLCVLAYWMLIIATPLARDAHLPWQKPWPSDKPISPTRVARDYLRIFRAFKNPARPPQPSGKSIGRPLGYRPTPHKRHELVVKGYKRHK